MRETKPPILYVDDEEENLNGFKFSFLTEYNIHTAQSAQEGLALMQQQDFWVVISDQRMPGVSGLEFIQQAKHIRPDAVYMILTAYSDTQTVLEAINSSGVYRYITKPWKKTELKIAIDNAIESNRLKVQNSQLILDLSRANQELVSSFQLMKQSELKFRNIFDNSTDPIIISDFNHRIVEANQAALKTFGYTLFEMLQLNTTDLTSAEAIPELKERLAILEREGVIMPTQIIGVRPNGERFNIEINSRVIDYENRKAIISVVRDITRRKETQKRILNAIIETEERERKRFSADIHDGIGPLLSTLKLYLNSLNSPKYSTEQKELMIQNINEVIEEAIQSSRQISNRLMPQLLDDFGLDTALGTFCEKVDQTTPFSINYQSVGIVRYTGNTEIILYRTVMEFVTNTIKHSEAKQVDIYLEHVSNKLNLWYKDNGIGFDVNEALNRKDTNLGLRNTVSRIESLNGQIKLSSEPYSGFSAYIEVPLT